MFYQAVPINVSLITQKFSFLHTVHQKKDSPDFTFKDEWCDSSNHYLVDIDLCAGKDFLLSPK